LTLKVNRSIFANQYLEDRPLSHNDVIDTCTLEGILSFTLTADGKWIVLPRNVAKWKKEHVVGFIVARFSDEMDAETSLCELLAYEWEHSACTAVLSSLEVFLQEETGRAGQPILRPVDSQHLTPMINDFLRDCREKLGVIPRSALKKVLVRT